MHGSHYYILAFAASLILRMFLEVTSTKLAVVKLPGPFYHYVLAYIALCLGLIISLHYLTRSTVEKIARLVLPSFILLLIAPAMDLLLTGCTGYKMNYIYSGEQVWMRYLSFFGPLEETGVSPGIRIEIAVILVLAFVYLRTKGVRILKSLFGTFLVYSVIYWWGASPYILLNYYKLINLFSEIKAYNAYNHINHNNFFLLSIAVLGIWLLRLGAPALLKSLVRNLRPYRVGHYAVMAAIGLIVGKFDWGQLTGSSWLFHLLLMFIALLCSILFSIITNDLEDQEIDRVSNRERPLVMGTVDPAVYRRTAWVCLGLAVVYSHAVSFFTMYVMLAFMGNYFLYSMPPVRLKRVTFFSKLIISINSLLMMVMGFVFAGHYLYDFPPVYILFVLAAFTPAVNFIDLKDFEGDGKAGIKTLPVVMGLKNAKRLIGVFFIIAHLSVWFLVEDPVFMAGVAALGVVQFFLVNRTNYSEKAVFRVHLLNLVLLAAALA